MYGGSIAASFKQIHLRDSTNQISLKRRLNDLGY